MLQDVIRLAKMEMRVTIVPLEESGEDVVQSADEIAPLRLLAIGPFTTEAVIELIGA